MGREAYIHPRLVLLAGAAGCVDAASFLGLQEVFTANQTGNTVLLGIALGRGEWDAVGRSGMALGLFCVGVVLASLVLRRSPQGWTGRVTAVLAAEAVVLLGIAALWEPLGTIALIGLAAAAMGLQSTAAQQIAVPGVMTTFITGTLTRVFTRLVTRDRAHHHERTPAASWLLYLAGAVAGGWLSRDFSEATGMAVGAVVLIAAIVPWPAGRSGAGGPGARQHGDDVGGDDALRGADADRGQAPGAAVQLDARARGVQRRQSLGEHRGHDA